MNRAAAVLKVLYRAPNLGRFALISMLVCAGACGAQERPRVAAVAWGKPIAPDKVSEAARFGILFTGLPSRKSGVQPYLDSLRAANPEIKLGAYTVLVEYWRSVAPNDTFKLPPFEAIEANDWWVRDAAGRRMSWTSAYRTDLVNITEWAPTDRSGMRYPQWLAQHVRSRFGDLKGLDYVFIDNFWYSPRPRNGSMDWQRTGTNQSNEDERIRGAYRKGLAGFVDALRSELPGVKLIGNADNDLDFPEFRGKLDGAYMECAIGKRWSPETRLGWVYMMATYRSLLKHTRSKGDVVLGACSEGGIDHRQLRYGLTSAMLEDGWFTYRADALDEPYFADEFAAPIGRPSEPPPSTPTPSGAWVRLYSNGMVIVNPTDRDVKLPVGSNYRRMLGAQEPAVNNGRTDSAVVIPPRDGLLLLKK